MIKSIKMNGIPPYGSEEQVIEAKAINFLFGLNGSGKTTISRVMGAPDSQRYEKCHIEWDGTPMKCVVYNRDYVAENFATSSVPGIFTLGKANADVQEQITACEGELNKLENLCDKLQRDLGEDATVGLRKQLADLESSYTESFWEEKKRLDNTPLQKALKGFRAKKDTFKEKLLERTDDQEEVLERQKLEQLCTQWFNDGAEPTPSLKIPDFAPLFTLETSDILKKVVVGKSNIDFSRLIEKLNNASWVRQGANFLPNSEGLCPFCQKPLDQELYDKINDYFDETYRADVQSIEKVCGEYSRVSDNVLLQLEQLLAAPSHFIPALEELRLVNQKLKNTIDNNKQLLFRKKQSPNEVVSLSLTKELTDGAVQQLKKANASIADYNNKIRHIKDEQSALSEKVWQYIRKQLDCLIKCYKEEKERLNKEIDSKSSELETIKQAIMEKKEELYSLEKRLTSVYPTAKGINDLLHKYGFGGFSLKVDDSKKNYQFIRANGASAFESLSEGERNLVTFLYFMYSLKGSIDGAGLNSDKIVVIDDPVSSLDSEVLFLVSSLIRDLFKDVFDGNGSIKQLFILSHNTFFFKQVSYKEGLKPKKTGYWMIRKSANVSEIKMYPDNPVTSTYEMLWDVVKDAQKNPLQSNTVTLANTMRRIIEYYFHFLGKLNLNSLHLDFPDDERPVVKSLISWVHAGSHSAFDDYSVTPNLYDSQVFLKVFREVFEKKGHLPHYDMMMSNKKGSYE